MSNKGQLLQDLLSQRSPPRACSRFNLPGEWDQTAGPVESFDQYVVLLKNTVTQMVYKHAISTVVPARPVNLQQEQAAE